MSELESQDNNDPSGDYAPILDVQIMDGYTFRAVITSMKNLCDKITFFFRKDGFSLQQGGRHQSSFFADFPASKLPKYTLEVIDDEGEEVDILPIRVDAADACRCFKNVGKNDYVSIACFPGSEALTIEVIKGKNHSTEEPRFLMLPIINSNEINMRSKPSYSNYITVKISATCMAQTFTQMISYKCKKVSFSCTNTSILCKGLAEGDRVGTCATWGDGYDAKTKVISLGNTGRKLTIGAPKILTFPIEVTRSLNKVNNLAPSSLVMISYQKDGNNICISSPVGTYGEFNMYITADSST